MIKYILKWIMIKYKCFKIRKLLCNMTWFQKEIKNKDRFLKIKDVVEGKKMINK